MNILIISHKPPFPIVDGGCLAMSRFLECISGLKMIEHITYFSLSTHKHPFHSKAIPKETYPNVRFENFPISTEINPFSASKELVKGKSYNLSRFYSNQASQKLREICKTEQFDIIIFESLFASVYLEDLNENSRSKFIYRAHNIEHSIWKNLAETTRNPIKKWYLKHLEEKLKVFEFRLIKDVDLVLPLSTKDEDVIRKNSDRQIQLIPVSMNAKEVRIDYEKTSLCFIGAFNWSPNIEAMEWFATSILPEVKKEFPNVELHIAGSFSNNISFLKDKDGIILHGFVESSEEFILDHGIFVAPLKSGSGVKMKVLEAMSLGSPCVLSEKAAEGIIGHPNFCKNSKELVSEIRNLLSSRNNREENGFYGKKLIENNYHPKSIENKLLDTLNQFNLAVTERNIDENFSY